MDDRKRLKRKLDREGDADVMRGRNFAGEQYAATEQEQTRERERVARRMPEESEQFVTDAEMEAREANSSPRDDDSSDRD
jgi:hypothetical protein